METYVVQQCKYADFPHEHTKVTQAVYNYIMCIYVPKGIIDTTDKK